MTLITIGNLNVLRLHLLRLATGPQSGYRQQNQRPSGYSHTAVFEIPELCEVCLRKFRSVEGEGYTANWNVSLCEAPY